jgi:TonB family protein
MKSYAQVSFGLSLLTHTLVIVSIPTLLSGKFSLYKEGAIKQIHQINEVKIVPQKIKPIKIYTHKLEESDIPLLPYIDDFNQKVTLDNTKVLSLDKPRITQERIREVAIADMPDKNLTKLPEYMDYYQLIRTKIAKTAQQLYNGEDGGMVLVSFTILADGRLGNVYLEENSVKSSHLQQIAIKSIHQAAPFPSFPKELANRSSLPVGITIDFKNN